VSGYLLDTSAFLILGLERSLAPSGLLARLAQGARYVTQVSAIEIAIKFGIGKLALPPPFHTSFSHAFDRMVSEFEADLLGIDMRHIEQLSRLPLRHRDPFDRLIISQALAEELTVVTRDRVFATYDGLQVIEI